ncbi:MAG: L,D-transpeptidase family protein [Filimonas sp.]|nr:L,D-transpeptidase family protein [Filimonas sp.]
MFKYFLLFLVLIIGALSIYYFYPEKPLPADVIITQITVSKSKREMNVYAGSTLLKTYKISLGKTPTGDKVYEGDNKTPEGSYTINAKNEHSVCYKNLGISYPDNMHRQQAKQLNKPPGGDIKIHGLPNGQSFWGKFHRFKDWTNGCIGVTDKEMEELFNAVPVGTPILIKS